MTTVAGVKNILIALNEEGDGRVSSALHYGLSLARNCNARVDLQAASVRLDLPSGRSSATVAGLVASENRRLREITAKLAEAARADSAMAGVICDAASPQLPFGELRARALAQSRVADVIVVDADPSALTVDGGLLRAMLFDSGRPAIVVPDGHDRFACDRIIVAWDGGAAASRAVAFAMPFLRASQAVEIVCFIDDKDLSSSAAGSDLAAALARHGVNATAKGLAGGGDVAGRLREQVGFFRADLIVMGGFVHSQIRQWLFGGVTQSMLRSSGAPLLIAR